ncbi:hypothetical protein L7F22_013858 [Adiantum nelumboides]|nr:hypothetical protein [Adiantum nelumboides]
MPQTACCNLKLIVEENDHEHHEWAEQLPNVMRCFMEAHGKKLRNDPLVRQKWHHLLNRFAEITLSLATEASSSLIPTDLEDEEKLIASKSFSINYHSLNLSKKPFETYMDPFIPSRFLTSLEMLTMPLPKGLLLTLLNGKNKQALMVDLRKILDVNASNLVENFLMATPFSMSVLRLTSAKLLMVVF